MSIRVMTAVWSNGPYAGGALLVLLAMADWADESGYCWPSVRTLAKKSRQTERNVRKCMRRMKRDGAISVKPGAGPHSTNLYRIKFEKFCEIKGQNGEELCSGLNEVPSENCAASPLSLVPTGEGRSSANTSLETSADTSGTRQSRKTRNVKVGQGATGLPEPDDGFDGHEWCLRTLKAYPGWNQEATFPPRAHSDLYLEVIQNEAPAHGGMVGAAEWLLGVTQEYARQHSDGTYVMGIEKFLRSGYTEVRKAGSDGPTKVLREAKLYDPCTGEEVILSAPKNHKGNQPETVHDPDSDEDLVISA